MLRTSFLKAYAREKLIGEYFRVLLAYIVCCIPTGLISLINSTVGLAEFETAVKLSGGISVLTVIVAIFVTPIFSVGFLRSIMRMKPIDAPRGPLDKRYDINQIFSGFSENYKNTLKITFMQSLKLFGWMLLSLAILSIVTAGIICMPFTPPVEVITSSLQDMLTAPVRMSLLYTIMLIVWIILILCLAPAIYKEYEYRMIPIIVAENPDIECKEAFRLTREIMHGYRKRLFCIELSFIGWMVLAFFISMISLLLGTFAIYALVPYIDMTMIQFYEERKLMMQPENKGEIDNEN